MSQGGGDIQSGTRLGNTLFWDGVEWRETELLNHKVEFQQGAGNTLEDMTHEFFTSGLKHPTAITNSVDGNYLYIIEADDASSTTTDYFLRVVDINNPAAPVLGTQLTIPNPGFYIGENGITVKDNWLFVATRNNLLAYDISNPAAPSLSGTLPNGTLSNRYFDIKAAGNYLFQTNFSLNQLEIIDISNPSAMSLVHTISGLVRPSIVNVFGNYLVVNSEVSGVALDNIHVYDISTITNPVLLSTFSNPAFTYIRGAQLNGGNVLYIMSQESVSLYDVTDFSNPVELSTTSAGQSGLPADFRPLTGVSGFVRGNNLYVADQGNTIYNVDVSDPYNPFLSDSFTHANLQYMESMTGTGNNFLYATNGLLVGGVEVINLEFNDAYVPTGIGIGTTTPDQLLSVNGNASKVGGGSWATFSDQRVKDNIKDYTKGLSEIAKLRPVSFTYNEKSGYDSKAPVVGLIAQEVEQILPNTVTVYDDSKGPSGLSDKRQFDSSEILWTLVNAVKELKARNEKLEKRIKELEKKK